MFSNYDFIKVDMGGAVAAGEVRDVGVVAKSVVPKLSMFER